jgi:hypothetical protein
MFSWLVKLLYSTFSILNTNTVWIVFQEKYEVFCHFNNQRQRQQIWTQKN